MSTLTASIHSARSLGPRVLHSRRTLGCWHGLWPATALRRKQRIRARERVKKERIGEQLGPWGMRGAYLHQHRFYTVRAQVNGSGMNTAEGEGPFSANDSSEESTRHFGPFWKHEPRKCCQNLRRPLKALGLPNQTQPLYLFGHWTAGSMNRGTRRMCPIGRKQRRHTQRASSPRNSLSTTPDVERNLNPRTRF